MHELYTQVQYFIAPSTSPWLNGGLEIELFALLHSISIIV